MSARSGITASTELLDAFKNFDVNALVIRVSDDSTTLIPDEEFPQPSSSDKSEVLKGLHGYFKEKYPQPGYIIVPEDEGSYAFISFIPDTAPIRQKMLYASTKNTLIQQLGSNQFKKSHLLAWTELDELNLKNYENSSSIQQDDSNALTSEEKMMKEINSLQTLSLAESGLTSQDSFKKELASMHGESETAAGSSIGGALLFDVEPSLKEEFEALPNFKNSGNLVTFNIDVPNETVKKTSSSSNVELNSLVDHLTKAVDSSSPHPQFAIYNYNSNKIAFIYSCPSGSKVKDRMIYASNRQGLISFIKSFADEGVVVDKVLEVGDLDELELNDLKPEVNQPLSTSRQNLKFNKPKGPRRR